jgi:hypothetical protein
VGATKPNQVLAWTTQDGQNHQDVYPNRGDELEGCIPPSERSERINPEVVFTTKEIVLLVMGNPTRAR